MKSDWIEPNQRVLIIDDNLNIHSDFRKILEVSDATADLKATEIELFSKPNERTDTIRFELSSACQGQEGVEMVQEAILANRPFAMAFVDMRMPPGWDGVTTILNIWKIDPDMQIVICTAYSDYSWSQLTEKVGQSDRLVVLKKPFDRIEVLQLATALTEKWRLMQQSRAKVADLEKMVELRTLELQGTMAKLSKSMAESERLVVSLQEALSKVKTLSGLVPICSGCKKIRDDKGFWSQLETYIQKHSNAQFSHGMCPDCMQKYYPDV